MDVDVWTNALESRTYSSTGSDQCRIVVIVVPALGRPDHFICLNPSDWKPTTLEPGLA